MRWNLMAAVCFLLVSCGTPVTLYTDEVFRNVAPEIVEAWKSTAPWKPALVKDLPPGSGPTTLEAELARPPVPSAILVGMALSDPERQSLQNAHPQVRMVFFTATGSPSGLAAVSVPRLDAWSTVARAAAPGPATVFYPVDVTPKEMSGFEAAWKAAGGGALTTSVGYQADKWGGTLSTVFQWAGPELDGPVQTLNPAVKVHGNPGTVRAAGASGLTWALKKESLGDFLWHAALDPEKKSHFLPLETVLERR